MTLVVGFDDEAEAPDGRPPYANRTCLVVRTRFGRIVDHEGFYEDTIRIRAFEEELQALGVAPVGATPQPA